MNIQTLRNERRRQCLALLALALFFALPAAAGAGDSQGFIYGRVTAESGTTYEGRLRWNGDEEAFWGDFFNGGKDELPYLDEVPRGERPREEIKVLGIKIGLRSGSFGGRSTVVRFGDMKKIEVGHGDEATLVLKDGSKLDVDGGSNDLGGDVFVWDRELGKVELDWDRIDTIEFLPAPAGYDVDVFRLHGTLESDSGTFEGFIQWDQEECLSTDILDGDGPDGDMEIAMGKIGAIERESRRSSRVVMRSGRELVLSGSNDVDDDNRGIYVEDPRYGRVLVKWDTFERLDFSEPGTSGPAYGDFEDGGPIRGTVTDHDGGKHQGEIVYDVDEARRWEMLNGEWDDVEYTIPFALVKSIEPDGDRARVVLVGGEKLTLEDAADVGDGNAGILVMSAGGERTYVAWDDVKRIDFDG